MVNLSRTTGAILKIRLRERSGKPIHKSEFAIDDKKSIEKELRFWKDKLGVSPETFRRVINNPVDKKEVNEVRELMKKKTEKDLQVVKNALSKQVIR